MNWAANWAAEHRLDGTIGRIVDVTPGPADQPATVIEVGQTWDASGVELQVTSIMDAPGGPLVSFGVGPELRHHHTSVAEFVARTYHLVERQG